MHKTYRHCRRGSALAGAAAFLVLSGCVTMDPSGIDPAIMRHHNWWNYYTRGQERLEAGNLAGAKSDFENCLGLRRDAKFPFAEEHWRVRTYGMHFLNAYFPHRELGVCHYLLNDMENAEHFLKKSIHLEPSGRAKHYLNQVHARTIRQKAIPAPAIELDADAMVKITRARKRTVSGRAAGPGLIQDLFINGQREFIELAAAVQPFEREVSLKSGLNRVTIEAVDLKGQRKSKVVQWVADWDPPVVTITGAQRIAGGGWAVEGVCTDRVGLSDITFIGKAANAIKAGGEKSVPLTFKIPKGATVSFRATDLAGNGILSAYNAASLGLEQRAALQQDRWLAAAGDGANLAGLLAAADGEAADTLKPSLKIDVSNRGVIEVFREEFFLSGEARDGGKLASVSINGENLLEEDGALHYHFARRLPLEDIGITNTFIVAATDKAGNSSSKTFRVVRQNPDYLEDEYRLSMGLPPMAAVPEVAGQADIVRLDLEAALVEWPARFNLVAREENWETILTEQKLSSSELADPRAALELGKIVPAELFLMGNLIKEAGGVTIKASIVDMEKGRVIAAADVYSESIEDFQERNFKTSGLAMKVEQNFPFVEGVINTVDASTVVINIGRNQGVSTGMKFIVLERSDPDTSIEDSDVRFYEDRWVQLAVSRTKSSEGTANVLPGEARGIVKTGDYVVSR